MAPLLYRTLYMTKKLAALCVGNTLTQARMNEAVLLVAGAPRVELMELPLNLR